MTLTRQVAPNTVQWVAGSQAGSETVWARAADAVGYGDWKPWTMTSALAA